MHKGLGCAKLEIALGRVWSGRLSLLSTLPWRDSSWNAVFLFWGSQLKKHEEPLEWSSRGLKRWLWDQSTSLMRKG